MAFSLRVFFAVAALIALAAFALGWLLPGLGMFFAAAASLGWACHAHARRAAAARRG